MHGASYADHRGWQHRIRRGEARWLTTRKTSGPPLLALEDRQRLPGPGLRCRGRAGRRAGVQHRHHRLPGNPDGPVVPRADRDDDRARDRQRRGQRRGRRVGHPFCAGFVVRNLSPRVSSWRARADLGALHGQSRASPGISGIDSRAITRRLRIGGAQRAVITRRVDDPAGAVERARKHPSLEGRDLVEEVTSAKPYDWDEASGNCPAARRGAPPVAPPRGRLRLRHQAQHPAAPAPTRGCDVTVVPAPTPRAKTCWRVKPDGVFLSNGPGDPAAVEYAVGAVRRAVRQRLPIFGICLGHQILGLALGGKTYKLKFGHHGGEPSRHGPRHRARSRSRRRTTASPSTSTRWLARPS